MRIAASSSSSLAAVAVGRRGGAAATRGRCHYTGFVEGEERVLRSEVTGRVLEVAFAEGDAGARRRGRRPARRRATSRAKIASKRARGRRASTRRSRRQEEQIALTESTWARDARARGEAERAAGEAAAVARRADAGARAELVAHRRQHRAAARRRARAAATRRASALDRAREMLARTEAEEREHRAGAGTSSTMLREQRELRRGAARASSRCTRAKYEIRAPAVADRRADAVHLARRAGAARHADPRGARPDRQVRAGLRAGRPTSAASRVGQRVEIELDSEPGRRVPGEVSFVADQANFTPEKIETRERPARARCIAPRSASSRSVERFQPGTEGNVYLVDEATRAMSEPLVTLRGLREALRHARGRSPASTSTLDGAADRRHRRPGRRRQDDAAALARRAARGRGRRGARARPRSARRRDAS